MYLNVGVIVYVYIYIINPANPEGHEAYMMWASWQGR
jgi:hypothetical protein